MKKYLLGLIALFLVIAGSAFSGKEPAVSTTDEVWFEYDPVNGNGPTDPANYVETGMSPACSDDAGTLCSVFAEADPGSGSTGNRKPLASSLIDIQNGQGFDGYVENLIHLRD